MPRRPTATCAECNGPMWVGTGSLPQGQAIHQACRRKRNPPPKPWVPATMDCPQCGSAFTQHRHGQVYCSYECRDRHRAEHWNRAEHTLTAAERGYGWDHQRERAEWGVLVDQGLAECARPDCLHVARGGMRLIDPGEPWDLGHNRSTGEWVGPEHRDCNRAEAAAYRNRLGKT